MIWRAQTGLAAVTSVVLVAAGLAWVTNGQALFGAIFIGLGVIRGLFAVRDARRR